MIADIDRIISVRKLHDRCAYPLPCFKAGTGLLVEPLGDSLRIMEWDKDVEPPAPNTFYAETRHYSAAHSGVSIFLKRKFRPLGWVPGQDYLTTRQGSRSDEYLITRATDEEIAVFAKKMPTRAESGCVRNYGLYLTKEERNFLKLPPVNPQKPQDAWLKITEWFKGDCAFLRVEPVNKKNKKLPTRTELHPIC